jgi:hypothetical protein
MRILMPLLMLSSVVAAPALARDVEGRHERLVFCSQLVTRNPDSGTSSSSMRSCCAFGDPWIAANHMSNCCVPDGYLRGCSDWNRINR